jgi:hypothetical protein
MATIPPCATNRTRTQAGMAVALAAPFGDGWCRGTAFGQVKRRPTGRRAFLHPRHQEHPAQCRSGA